MKKYFLLLVIVFFNSCNSEYNTIPVSDSLDGKWLWVQSTGGITGTTNTPKSTNKVVYIEFSGSSFKTYTNDKLTYESTFTIKNQESILGGQRAMIVNSDSLKYFPSMSFTIKNNTLELIEECHDCYGSSYVRLK